MKHMRVDLRRTVVCLTLVALAGIPLGGEVFYTRLFTRIMLYAMVACSLDLILGYGGMVSFGHAAFVGVGAYTVAILGYHGVTNGLIAWPASVVMAALLALVIGGISLRTSGVYFIMITLAFAQMLYYLAVSLKTYGGDDGVRIVRNTFAGVLDLRQHTTLYYVVWLGLCLVLWLGRRLVYSRFGVVLRAIKENERRIPEYRKIKRPFPPALCAHPGAVPARASPVPPAVPPVRPRSRSQRPSCPPAP